MLYAVPLMSTEKNMCFAVCLLVFRLRLYQNFESFRVLVCGGDGSIGWVLNEIDKQGLHKQVSPPPSSLAHFAFYAHLVLISAH